MRLIDAVPGTESIEVGIAQQRDRVRLRYGSGLSYTPVPAGSCPVTLSVVFADRHRVDFPAQPFMLTADRRYAAVVMGTIDTGPRASLHLFEELPSIYPLQKSQTLVRALNACPDAGPVDLLFNNLATFKNLKYGRMSSAIALPASGYTCSVKTAGDRYAPLDLPRPIGLIGGKCCLLVVMGKVRDGSVAVEAFQE